MFDPEIFFNHRPCAVAARLRRDREQTGCQTAPLSLKGGGALSLCCNWRCSKFVRRGLSRQLPGPTSPRRWLSHGAVLPGALYLVIRAAAPDVRDHGGG